VLRASRSGSMTNASAIDFCNCNVRPSSYRMTSYQQASCRTSPASYSSCPCQTARCTSARNIVDIENFSNDIVIDWQQSNDKNDVVNKKSSGYDEFNDRHERRREG
jgi:hypothetical protein